MNIGPKLQAIVESRAIRFGKDRIKAENIRFAVGITYPTYLKYKDGDKEPSEQKVSEIKTSLNSETNISPRISVQDFSDAVSLEEFCHKFGISMPSGNWADTQYIPHAEKKRLTSDHPFDDFSFNLRDAKFHLRNLKGVYRLLRNNGKGAPVLQSVLQVRGLLSQAKRVQIVCSLTVPAMAKRADVPDTYYYSGIICPNREVYYWLFNQDDDHRRDFIILVTTKNGDPGFGGEYVSVGQDYFPIPQSGIVGIERIEIPDTKIPSFVEDETRVFLPGEEGYLPKLARLHELNSIAGRSIKKLR